MKRFKSFLALVAILSLSLIAAPASAQAIFSSAGTATQTNTVVTFSPASPKIVEVYNYGASRLYVARNAVATAAFGTTIALESCEAVRLVLPAPATTTTLGLITASSTTTSYQVYGFYSEANVSSVAWDGVPFNLQMAKIQLPNCNASTLLTVNGAQVVPYADSELITLSTGGLTTDSAGNLLHANSIIDSVVCRVTTTITTTTSWGISDPTTANRFSATSTNLTAGSTIVGLAAMFGVVNTTAAGPTQAADAKLRITAVGANPGAGVVRCTVFGRTFVAPTS